MKLIPLSILLVFTGVACKEDLDGYMEDDLNDYWDYLTDMEPEEEVKLEGLEVESALSGYPVLTVKAATCSDPLAEVELEVQSCDATFTKKYYEQVCKKGGASICLPSTVETRCVRVKGGGQTSADLTLPPYQTYNRSQQTRTIGWQQDDTTNTSSIIIVKQTGVYKYCTELTLSATQHTPGRALQVDKVPHQKKSCELSKPVTLEGVNHDHTTIFTAQWHHLNPSCVYLAIVRPYNPCNQPLGFGVTLPDLHYITLNALKMPQREVVVVAAVWVVVLVAVVTVISALLVCSHLYNTWKRTQRALASWNSNEKMQQEAQVVKHYGEKHACLGDAGRNSRALRDALLEGAVQRKVLMVYARDAQGQVAALINLLQERTDYQILDLYDPLDLDKLRDGTVWLARRLLDPATFTLLVASNRARRLQVLHASTPGHGIQSLQGKTPPHNPHQPLDCRMLPENTASQMTGITTAGGDKVDHSKFDNTFVQNVNEKVANDTQYFSSKVDAELNPESVSLLMLSSPDQGDVDEKSSVDRWRSLPAIRHQKCWWNISGYRETDAFTYRPHSQVIYRDGAMKTCVDGIIKTNEGHDPETNVVGRKVTSIAGSKNIKIKPKVNMKVEIRSEESKSNRAGKEEYGEPRQGGTFVLADSTIDCVGQEVFHFLFLDFLHKLEASFFSHDYDRLYQIKFRETPDVAVLDHVTPGRLYHLPDHLDHLIHTLTCYTPNLDTYLPNCI